MTSSPSELEKVGEAAAERLRAFYARVAETAMRGLPMLNDALDVAVVGLRPAGNQWLCVLVTPWFMNLVLLPMEPVAVPVLVGAKTEVILPGGSAVEFIQSDGEGLGPHRMCSLFSPVFEFETMEVAVQTAEAVLAELSLPVAPVEDEDGMRAIWEGRIVDAELQAETERLAALGAEAAARNADAAVSRRALFGLGERPGAEP